MKINYNRLSTKLMIACVVGIVSVQQLRAEEESDSSTPTAQSGSGMPSYPVWEPKKPSRSSEEILKALHAYYDGRKAPNGETYKVTSMRGAPCLQVGKVIRLYLSKTLVPGDAVPAVDCESWMNTTDAKTAPDMKGKVVVFQICCTMTSGALSSMQKFYDGNRERGLEMVVLTDESAKEFNRCFKKNGLTMPVAVGVDGDRLRGDFGVSSMSAATFVVGRDGRIVFVGQYDEEGLETFIKGLLEEKPADAKK